MSDLRVGIAQVPQTGDIEVNFRKIVEYLNLAGKMEVDILCFPEAQTQGYRKGIVRHDAPVLAERLEEIHREVARICGDLNMACVLGTELPHPSKEKPYNSALIIDEFGQRVGVHSKTILTPPEATAYSPGKGLDVYNLKGICCGVVICFEGFRFPQTTRACVAKGASIIFHPQNNTTRPGTEWKLPIHESMIVTRATENTVYFVSANMCHRYNNCRSLVIAPNGLILAASILAKEKLIYTDIDPSKANRAMFLLEKEGMADVLYGDSYRKEEIATINESDMFGDRKMFLRASEFSQLSARKTKPRFSRKN